MSDAGPGSGAALRRLTEVSRALTYARSLGEVLDLTVDCSTEILGAEQAVLMLIGEDDLLHVRASRNIEDRAVERFREPLDENLLTRLEGLMGRGIRQRFVGVPLVVHGGVIGLLGIRRGEPGPPDDDDEWLLSAIADQAAVALESARHRELRETLSGRVGELERRERNKDEAIEILSHDLRAPLNAMVGYAALLRAEVAGPLTDRQKDLLGRLSSIGAHMESLLDNVLEMARLERGKLTVRAETVVLGDVVADAIGIVEPAAAEAHIQIEDEGGAVPPLESDPHRLRQVLVHLLDNAVKYSPEGSVVRVTRRAVDHGGRAWVEVGVADQGPGISKERQSQIFEPYVRADTPTKRGSTGVGLGLAIAMGVVRRLGGRLTVESEPGHGATFRVRVPLEG